MDSAEVSLVVVIVVFEGKPRRTASASSRGDYASQIFLNTAYGYARVIIPPLFSRLFFATQIALDNVRDIIYAHWGRYT